MTDNNQAPGRFPPQGPISQRLNANAYLEEKKIPQIFESLLASLMLECPDDHMTYLNQKLDLIKEIGTENIAWDTFVAHLHPDKTDVLQQNIPRFDLPQDKESFDNDKSTEQPVLSGSSQLFQLTDPAATTSRTNSYKDAEAVPEF